MPNVSATASVLLYCRAGFEAECAQETMALAAAAGIAGHARARRDAAYMEFVPADAQDLDAAARACRWRDLVFGRQSLAAFARASELSREDRLTPLLEILRARGEHWCEAWVESPDTNEGKALAPLCRSFGSALAGALKKARLIDADAPRRLHVFFPQGDEVVLATARSADSAPWELGIPRLKFPREAPSRSTLKLDEAFQVLLDESERERWLRPGASAVDLGAAPGGWTYQFVRRSIKVIAVDNGPMAPELMDSGLVTHLREDGFRYQPRKPVDWMVCDMVDQPRRVAERMATWLAEGWCRRSIFNLKLPMKKRYEEVRLCFDLIRARLAEDGRTVELRGKQLYHDREEITVYASVAGRGAQAA